MDPLDRLDERVLLWFQARRTPGFDPVVLNFTDLGSFAVLLAVTLVAIVVFLCLRRWRTAVLLLATALASWYSVELVKRFIERARPAGVVRVPTPSLLTEHVGKVPGLTGPPGSRSY